MSVTVPTIWIVFAILGGVAWAWWRFCNDVVIPFAQRRFAEWEARKLRDASARVSASSGHVEPQPWMNGFERALIAPKLLKATP